MKKIEPATAQTKPGATNKDTLTVAISSVVIFQPDSLQLQKIKAITAEEVFKTETHEFEFQSYTVKEYVRKNRPDLHVYDAKDFRFIDFVKADKTHQVIDLDQIPGSWGMYVFDPKKEPRPSEMMNVDTEIPDYFSK